MLIDKNALLEHLENDIEILQEIYELFCEETVSGQVELDRAIGASDLKGVQQEAHKLKGMMANFMAHDTCKLLNQLEELDSLDSLGEIEILVSRLKKDIAQLHAEIKTIIDSQQNENLGP